MCPPGRYFDISQSLESHRHEPYNVRDINSLRSRRSHKKLPVPVPSTDRAPGARSPFSRFIFIYILINYKVKYRSSQVVVWIVGLRDRVAIIRTLISIVFILLDTIYANRHRI